MLSSTAVLYLFFAYNAQAQVLPDCSLLPSNLPLSLKNLLSLTSAPTSAPKCGCPDNSCGCFGSLIAAPGVPPFGCVGPVIGLPNPTVGVDSCGCKNAFNACNCGNPAVGNLCGKSTPSVGIATSCGCSDPAVRIIDGCPTCQPVYSYNLPSLGLPTCGCASIGLTTCGCGGIGMPSYLPSIGLPFVNAPALPCGCPVHACTCKGPCGRPLSSCTCNSPCGCPNVNSCGCIEVPCGPPKVKTTCTCVTPTIETPCGCAQGQPQCACTTTLEVPTCGIPVVPPFAPVIGCSRYLRQVVVQPPYL